MKNIQLFILYFLSILVLNGCQRESLQTYQGYAEGEFVNISSTQSGKLDKLFVKRGDKVSKDSNLYALECDSEVISLTQTQEALSVAQSTLNDYNKGLRPQELNVIKAQLSQALANAKNAQEQLTRNALLYQSNAVSKEQFDNSTTLAKSADGKVKELRDSISVAKLSKRSDQILAQEAHIKELKSALFATTHEIYDIRGSSTLLDANMSQFLDKWRTETITPVKNGTYKNVYVNGDSTKKIVALTFDDAPDENNTHKILDILKKHDVKASFFMIGATMNDDNATVVKRAYDEGNLVLSHSFNHPRFTTLDQNTTYSQLDSAATQIKSITGSYPILFRPPYGSINQNVVEKINAAGSSIILWSLDSLDWTLKDPFAVANNVVSNVRNGDIILMHRNPTSVASLEMVIETLHSIGYTFATVDEMLGLKAYK